MPFTETTPKVMVKVNGKPLLEWVLRWLGAHEVRNIVLGVAHLKESVMNHFRDGARLGLSIRYSEHTVEGGTAQGFRLGISRYVDDEDFLALNGDQVTNLDVQRLARFHAKHRPVATIAVTRPNIPFGQIKMNRTQEITRFVEKPIAPFYCNMGIYAFNKSILEYLNETGDIEKTMFPILAAKKKLKAYIHKGHFITVNTPKDLAEAERELADVVD